MMKQSTLNFLMVLIGINFIIGVDMLVQDNYILGALQITLSIILFALFNKSENEK